MKTLSFVVNYAYNFARTASSYLLLCAVARKIFIGSQLRA